MNEETRTISDWLEIWSELYGNHEALCDCRSSYSYQALNTNVKNLSLGLSKIGIRKNDKVILQMENRNEFVFAFFALVSLGSVPILVTPGLRINDLVVIAEKTNPVMYIRPDEYMGFSYAKMGVDLQLMNPSIKNILGASDILKMMKCTYNNVIRDERIDSEDIALILLSGGTTNVPKLIPITNHAFIYHSTHAGKICQLNQDSTYMAVMPVEHKLTLFSPGIMGTLFNGGKVVMCSDSSCDIAFSMIEKEKVSIVGLVPSVAKIWIEDLEWEDSYNLSSLQYCVLGGARLEAADACQIMNTLECNIIQAYGMSEGFLCLSRGDDSQYERTFYQGKPISEMDQVKIVDDYGQEQPCEEIGEIIVKGPYLFSGYYEMDSSNCFTADGFYHTGDLGYVTANGYIKITGRKSEQINRMGEKIMPSEIEGYLNEHEKIKEATVVGISDTMLGERSCAFVRTCHKNLKVEEVRDYLNSRGIAQFKIPDQIIIVEDFPYTAAGKINKKLLINMAER